MSYTLVRNESINSVRARGLAFDVVDADSLTSVGVVVDGVTGWRVHTAGFAVQVDQGKIHKDASAAIDSIIAARAAASEPGGMLHVDESGLTGFQRAVIDFAGKRFKYIGTRETAISELFDMSATRYAQHLLNLLENPAAAAYAPAIIRVERAKRDAAKAKRSLKTAGSVS